MKADKITANAASQILLAYKFGGVSAAVESLRPYLAFKTLIRDELSGKIPAIFLDRIFREVL